MQWYQGGRETFFLNIHSSSKLDKNVWNYVYARLKEIFRKTSVDKIPSICVSRKCSIMTSCSKAVYSAMTFR